MTGYIHRLETSIGRLGIVDCGGAITHVLFENDADPPGTEEAQTPLTINAARQILEYLLSTRREFDIPLHPAGTQFQLACWEALRTIPYGQTRTYSQIAKMLGRPNAYRAVGSANSRNPIPIILPCHRVIGSDGTLTGFRGGLTAKEFLINLEKHQLQGADQ